MADTFRVFYLGNFASIDPNEGSAFTNNTTSENAAALQGVSSGSAANPLYNNLQTLSPGSTGYGNDATGAYGSDNYRGFGQNDDTFRINSGPNQTFDAIATYTTTIYYANGLTPQVVTAVIFQDTNGNTYLAPAPTNNAYQAALEAGPIESISIGNVVSNNTNMTGSRVDGNYLQPDGTVDGTASADAMNAGYQDGQADQINANANEIRAAGGNDTVSAGDGADTIYGGAGNDVLNGDNGNDVIRGDSDIGTPTTFSWANQGIADNASVTGGITGATASGDIQVAMTVLQEQNFQSITMQTDEALYNYNTLSDTSSLSVFGGAPGADINTATVSLNFSALNSNVANEVSDVTFGIFDIDQAAGFVDQVTIRAYDANNNLIPVTLTAGDSSTISVNNATGTATSSGAGTGAVDSVTGFLQVSVAGPVARIEIDYNNPDPGDAQHAIRIGDLRLTPLNTTAAGNDTINGGAGNDAIDGEGGNDSLNGGSGSDTISGGAGSDTITGGTGNDSMTGGDGADVFIMGNGFGVDTIAGGEGGTDLDTLQFNTMGSAVNLTYNGPESGVATNGANSVNFTQIESIFLTSFNDVVNATAGGVTLDTGAGNDTITVGQGVYDLNAGDGDDRVIRNEGSNQTEAGSVIDGGAGTDTYVAGGALGINTINLQNNQLEYLGDARGTLLNFENVELDNIAATVYGNDGANVITAFGTYDNLLDGGGGNDSINAGAGNDTVSGGDGNDTLDGGAGNDTIGGGAGNDEFIYSGGNDLITDFNAGNTGGINDGDPDNNDFLDLGSYYGSIADLRADFDDNGILDQSAFATSDYVGKTLFNGGSISFLGPLDRNDFSIENTGVICFCEGTAIRTPRGDVLVENLNVGDMVTTMDNGPQRIRWINRRSYGPDQLAAMPHLHPVVIQRGVFGAERNLLVSQQHGILMGRTGDSFARAKHLAEVQKGVRIATGKKKVTYIHIMFESHQVIFAENVPSESFYPGPMALKAMKRSDRIAFARILPALGKADVTRDQVAEAYGPTSRTFMPRKVLLGGKGRIKAPSQAMVDASNALAESWAKMSAQKRRGNRQTAEAA